MSQQLVSSSISSKVVSEDDKELYSFAYEAMLWHLLGWITALFLGLLAGCFKEILLYMLLFTPLRIYSGGFHKGAYLSCYVYSTLLLAGIIVFCNVVAESTPIGAVIIGAAISAAVIFLLAPIADENKPLDASETKKYKKTARLILSAELLIFAVMILCGVDMRLLLFIAVSPVTVAVLLLASVLQYKVKAIKGC